MEYREMAQMNLFTLYKKVFNFFLSALTKADFSTQSLCIPPKVSIVNFYYL